MGWNCLAWPTKLKSNIASAKDSELLISAPNGIQETCAHPNVVGLFTLLSEDAKQLKPASVPTEARCAHETCLAAQLAAELA